MKISLFIILLTISVSSAFAETDTLKIHLKNGETEIILTTDILKVEFEKSTGVNDEQANALNLKGNYPNPFTESTTIKFELDQPGSVIVNIYNNSGIMVDQLASPDCKSGDNTMIWDCKGKNGNKLPSGTYYYEVKFKNEILIKNMIMVK